MSCKRRRLDERLRRLRVPERERKRVLDLLWMFPLMYGAVLLALHLHTRR